MVPSLMPHAVCWRQDPQLIWTMAITNAITFLSYLSICIALFYLARKTGRAIARDWVFFLVGFALFIVACGSTHLLEVITTWVPVFWADAWTNIITAILSGYVALQFIRRAPELGFGINDYAQRSSTQKLRTHALKTACSQHANSKSGAACRPSSRMKSTTRSPQSRTSCS